MERRVLRVDRSDSGSRLDVFLARRLPRRSRRHAKLAIRQGNVFVDGRRLRTPGLLLLEGMGVELYRSLEERQEREGDWDPDRVLYEDPFLIVVDKPPGVVVQSHHDYDRGSLIDRLEGMFLSRSGARGRANRGRTRSGRVATGRVYLGILQLLDRETSGVMVLSKSRIANKGLSAQFRDNAVTRESVALVHGRFDQPSGVRRSRVAWNPARGRLGPHPHGGWVAETGYEVVREFEDASLVLVRPRTLRSHQIRLHLAELGHPLLGDPVYGEARDAPAPRRTELDTLCGRRALHSHRLGFVHPMSSKRLTFEAPWPPDFRRAIEALEPGRSAKQASSRRCDP